MIDSLNFSTVEAVDSFARNRSPAEVLAKVMLLRGLVFIGEAWVRDAHLPVLISERVARALLESPLL